MNGISRKTWPTFHDCDVKQCDAAGVLLCKGSSYSRRVKRREQKGKRWG